MEILISILKIFGLIFLAMLIVAFAARTKLRGRQARRANEAARFGVEQPASPGDVGSGAGRPARGHHSEHASRPSS
jgi:hypothetical protein